MASFTACMQVPYMCSAYKVETIILEAYLERTLGLSWIWRILWEHTETFCALRETLPLYLLLLAASLRWLSLMMLSEHLVTLYSTVQYVQYIPSFAAGSK